jgi:hypothetical protein
MESFLNEILKKYQDIGLSQDNLIKLIFLLQDNPYKEMAAIQASDANFAIQHRDRIKATIKALKDFLVYSKMNDYYENTNFSFIPLFFIAYHLFHKQIDDNKLEHYFDNFDSGNEDFPLIKRWLYHSLLNGVFRSRGAGWVPYKTGIRKILETIKNYKNIKFPITELFQVYTNHLNVFTTNYTIDNLDQLDNSFVFFLMYDRTRTIRTNDIDHIMPKSILEEKGFDNNKINCIQNYQLIDYGTNRGTKNGKPLSEWINNPSYVQDKASFVTLHLIPMNEYLWSEDNFLEFREERAKLIIQKIELYTNSH